MKSKYSENILKTSFVIAILLLLAITGENYRQFQIYSESQQTIITSHEIQSCLEKLSNHITEVETAYHLYLTTKDEEVLSEYTTQKLKIQEQLKSLRELTEGDSIAQLQIDHIESTVNNNIILLNKHLTNEEDYKLNNRSKKLLQNPEKLKKEVMPMIKAITHKESNLLKEKENLGIEKYKMTPLLLLLTALFSLSIFLLSFYMLFSYLKKLRKNNARLRINNMIYEQAEQISHSGHWYFEPGKNHITFSKNLYRLFGYEPNSFKPSLKKYLKQIKEEERPIVVAELKKLKREGAIKATDITIIDANGNEKCLRFVARLVVDEFGQDLVIGANKDLTKEIETNKKLIKLNNELSLQNDILKNAESIAMIGSYSYDLGTKKSKFSDNLYKILGHEPQSFDASIQKLKEYVHKGDQDEYINSVSLDTINNDDLEYKFRIIDNNDNLKYILAKKKVFYNKDNKILIVNFKDITEEILISHSLEEKNDELLKINAELESFNHIASHDLQEPLRKIQTFISILQQMEGLKLTKKQSEYLHKIHQAANRMQNLVIDLLSFSRASKDDKIYEDTNLSKLLESAIQELQTDIQAQNVHISHDELPNATVIRFQFQQLFLNLLNNSIKYSHQNRIPTLLIKTKKVEAKDLLILPNYNEKDLVKITFEDNGIGFEQQYAEKIFTLFHRLHQKNEYSGTGIGLAICKKIMQNHKGTIYAEGSPGQGAKFILLFPKYPNIKPKN